MRHAAVLALMLTLAAPVWAGAAAGAQASGCTSVNPPCPPPATFALWVMTSGDTVTTSPTTVRFSVQGIKNFQGASVRINGALLPSTQWHFDASGTTATGSASVTLAANQSNTITVQYCDSNDGCLSKSATVFYLPPPPPPVQGPPILSAEPGSQFRRALADCAGCANATLSYSTPAYRSVDEDRAVTLVYSSATSAPTGLVVIDVNPNSTTLPDRISISLLGSNGSPIALAGGGTETFYTAGQGINRVSAFFDASGYTTGAYNVTAVVRNWWGSTMLESRLPVRVLIANQRMSGFGSGWSMAGLQRLTINAAGDAAISDAGNILAFPSCGSNCWTAPAGEASSLVLVGSTVERRYIDGTVATFDRNSGLLTQIRDRFGLATSYAYDGYGRPYQITDPAGFITSISWTGVPGSASIASITTPGGRISRIQTDAQGQLVDITDPDSVRALFVAYANNRVITTTDRLGATSDIQYDAFGGLASITGPALETTDRGFAQSTTTYASREVALLPAAGSGTSSAPGARVFPDSVWLRVRSQRGDSLRVSANGAGDPLVIVRRNPQNKLESTTIAYNDAGQPKSIVSTSGAQLLYEWVGSNLTDVTDLVSGVTTSYTYNSLGQPTIIWINGKAQTHNFYSADPRSVLDSTSTGNATVRLTHDGAGRVLTMRDGEQHQTTITYQSSGFANTATVTRDGKTTQFGYDGYGRPNLVIDAAGRRDSVSMDVLNRTTRAVAPDHSVSTWNYDDINRLYSFTDAKSQQYHTTTDVTGAPIFQSLTGQPAAYFHYDSDGNLSSWTSRGGRTVTVAHDALGRPTQVVAGGLTTTIAYDTAGAWIAYANAEATDTVFMDGEGRVKKQVTVRGGQAYSMVSTYGDRGERRSLTISSPVWGSTTRSLTFGVDTLGRPNFVGDFGGKGTSIAYNKDHRPQTITLPTGSTSSAYLQQSFTYGANERVKTMLHSAASTQLNWTYTHDVLDRLRTMFRGGEDEGMRRTLTYDLQGRLVQASDSSVSSSLERYCENPFDVYSCHNEWVTTWSPLRQETYTYDAVGNRTDRGAVLATGNQLTSFDGYTMSYDADGNLQSKSGHGVTQTFGWNDLGQLVSVTTNGVTTTFGYDGLGRRVRKTSGGVTTSYLYDGDNLVMQLNASGQPVLEFSYYPGVDHPHAVRKSSTGAVYYYITSEPGNVVALVDQNKAVVNSYEYTPFGSAIAATEQVAQPFRFTARELDSETGLYYYRARYYDPSLARFISEDPIGLAGGVNPYAYAGDDPVNYRDPSGLDWVCAEFSDRMICVWQLEAIVVVAQGVDEKVRSGASQNFLNPNARGGFGISQSMVDFSAGVGDALLLNTGPAIRRYFKIDNVNTCSSAYRYGGWAAFALGAARVGYAGLAKGISVVAASGVEASAMRTTLKQFFRLGLARSFRQPNLSSYATDLALREAAGRTDIITNAYGAGIAVSGAENGAGVGCQ